MPGWRPMLLMQLCPLCLLALANDECEKDWLLVWNIFYFSILLGMSSSQLMTFIFFRGVGCFTTNQRKLRLSRAHSFRSSCQCTRPKKRKKSQSIHGMTTSLWLERTTKQAANCFATPWPTSLTCWVQP